MPSMSTVIKNRFPANKQYEIYQQTISAVSSADAILPDTVVDDRSETRTSGLFSESPATRDHFLVSFISNVNAPNFGMT